MLLKKGNGRLGVYSDHAGNEVGVYEVVLKIGVFFFKKKYKY
jgi:hypothetical protein